VNQHIQPWQGRGYTRCPLADTRRITQIQPQTGVTRPGPSNFVTKLIRGDLRGQIRPDDVAPGPRQRDRSCPPHTTGAAGDQRDRAISGDLIESSLCVHDPIMPTSRPPTRSGVGAWPARRTLRIIDTIMSTHPAGRLSPCFARRGIGGLAIGGRPVPDPQPTGQNPPQEEAHEAGPNKEHQPFSPQQTLRRRQPEADAECAGAKGGHAVQSSNPQRRGSRNPQTKREYRLQANRWDPCPYNTWSEHAPRPPKSTQRCALHGLDR